MFCLQSKVNFLNFQSGQGNAIRDLTTQFAALQSKFHGLQEQKNQQDVEMRRMKSSQVSMEQHLRNLQQGHSKLGKYL